MCHAMLLFAHGFFNCTRVLLSLVPPCSLHTNCCRQRVEKDRLYVYCAPLARELPPLPPAKVLVAALPYTHERLAATAAEVALGR